MRLGGGSRSKTCGVEKVSKLPQGSQAIEQQTISGLSRHGQPEFENHVRAPMASQDIQSTIYHQQSPQPIDTSAVLTGAKMRLARHVEKRRPLAKVCRSGNAKTPRHASPKGTGTCSGKGSSKGKSNEHLPHDCVVARKDTRKQIANSRLRHVRTAERLVT